MLNNMLNIINSLNEFDVEYINETLLVMRSNATLEQYNMAIGGLFTANPEFIGRDDAFIVVVDDYFYKLSNNAKLFTLAHELGHLNHTEQDGQYVRNIKDEYEADENAIRLIGLGATVNALEEYKDMFKNEYEMDDDVDTIIDINLRLDYIMNKNITTC